MIRLYDPWSSLPVFLFGIGDCGKLEMGRGLFLFLLTLSESREMITKKKKKEEKNSCV